MSDRVFRTYRMPIAASRSAVVEVELVENEPPKRWRLRLALWLIKLGGKLARMRVRVVNEP